MAKIALITDEINPISLGFASSLRQQNQEVLFLSSDRNAYSQVPTFTLMTPFKDWSLLEGLRALPHLTAWNPDIWHFLFTGENARARGAHWALAAFASALPQKTLVASFFANQRLKSLADRAFLRLFDLRTFASRSHLMRVKRIARVNRGLNEVLPPIESAEFPDTRRVRDEIERLAEVLYPFILMPDPPPAGFDPQLLRSRGIEILLLSDRFKFHSNFFYTGPLGWAERRYLLEKSRALILAGCDLSVVELRRFFELSEQTQTPLMVSQYQNELLPGLCHHERSGWVLERGWESLGAILDTNPRLELKKDFSGLSHMELTDSTLNELLRMYNRAFSVRWS